MGPMTETPTPDNLKLEGIDFYHRYKDDIKLLAEMGFKVFVFQLPGHVFIPMATMRSRMSKG